jgi:hypothetical protein
MKGNTASDRSRGRNILSRVAPGLGLLASYQREWLKHDLIAGVSVAAVALPTAIAYAQIIGLDPVNGLYAIRLKHRANDRHNARAHTASA